MILAEITPEHPNQITSGKFDWRYKDRISTIPGAKFRQDKFLLPRTWPTALAMATNLSGPGLDLQWSDELKEWFNGYYTSRILPAYNLRSVVSMEEGYDFLFPHQKADVQFLSTARRAILSNDMGSGKLQPVSEPVLTPNGWTTMGELSPGDFVIGQDGKPSKVIHVYPQGVQDAMKVTFKDDSFTYAGRDHLWDVQSHKDTSQGRHRILTTQDLLDYGVNKVGPGTAYKYRVPVVDPVEFEKRDLKIDPYTLGALLGDGYLNKNGVTITSVDSDIVDRITSKYPDLTKINLDDESRADQYRFTKDSGIYTELLALELLDTKSHNKFIPTDYKFSSIEDRVALLQGLMDTDGTVGKAPAKNPEIGGAISYCTVSIALAFDVRELVQSLGGTVSWNYHKRPKLGNYDPVVLTIKLPESINPFHMKRKMDLVVQPKKYTLTRFISNIEFSHREESVCIFVDNPKHLYVTRDYIVTHNTFSSSGTIRHMHEKMGEDVFPLLIACPNSTKISWGREFERVYPGRKITVVDGTAAQRRKQLKDFMENDGEVLIINWDLLRHHSRLLHYGGTALKKCVECGGIDEKIKASTCEVHIKELNEIDFKSVIGDEVHRISDPSSKVARAFKAATGDADIRIGLSGTPINATPDQMFSALNWLYPDAYPSKVKFLDRFCDVADNQWGGSIVLGVKKSMEKEFFEGIDPILRRMPKDVILPFLPPIVRIRRDVEMGAKQAKAYKQMKEKMIAELDDDITMTTSPLVRLTRLLQFASAYAEVNIKEVYDKNSPIPGAKIEEEYLTLTDPSCKIDAFMDDLEDFGDSSVVVFAQHKQLINLLAARLDKNDIRYGLITGDQDAVERQAYMDAFQDGKLQFILCTIQAGGTGITLTRADTMVFLQRSYDMIGNLQAEARAHRIGSEQHDKIRIIDYITTGTADEAVLESIARKKDNLEFILRDTDTIKSFIEGNLLD